MNENAVTFANKIVSKQNTLFLIYVNQSVFNCTELALRSYKKTKSLSQLKTVLCPVCKNPHQLLFDMFSAQHLNFCTN